MVKACKRKNKKSCIQKKTNKCSCKPKTYPKVICPKRHCPGSRNAFILFYNAYRKSCYNDGRTPVWVLAIRAGQAWRRMPQEEKNCYIEAARRSAYVYKSRDRCFNTVLDILRKAIVSKDYINLCELAKAEEHVQLWKGKVLREICQRMAKCMRN